MSHRPTAPSGAGTGHRYQAIAAFCSAVLSLPPRLAGMMPYRMTQKRSAVTPHSRARMTIVTHHGSRSYADSRISAVPVSALSAIGSATLPNEVTSDHFRAIQPATKSPAEASQKPSQAAFGAPEPASPEAITITTN